MSEREAFIRAICAEPYEDTPRLAFADWLQEHGEDERAEFIRLQILLYRTSFIRNGGPEAKWPEPWIGRIQRVCELAKRYGNEWAPTVARMRLRPLLAEWWCRGFVERVEFPLGMFFANVEAVFREQPVRRVSLSGRGPLQDVTPLTPEYHRWFWTRTEKRDSLLPHEVPADLFDAMQQPADGYKWASDAHDALSVVLVAYGRKKAGIES